HFQDVIVQLPNDLLPDPLPADLPAQLVSRGNLIELATDDVDKLIHSLIAQQVPLQQMRVRSRTLEDLFLQLTGKELRS
ncbi:MAG: ABC transporter ATP-binding protein, partial [Gammaproteobacteria bacterium]